MLENLFNLVKENAGSAIINNPAIPNEKNDAAISEATTGIMDHLKSAMSGGGLSSITEMFSGGDVKNNPMITSMSSGVAQKLMSKFGISSEQASGVVSNLVPNVMSSLVKKTNDPNDKSFDLQGIIGSLSGGEGLSGVLGGLKNLF